jgi:hypothetical protein
MPPVKQLHLSQLLPTEVWEHCGWTGSTENEGKVGDRYAVWLWYDVLDSMLKEITEHVFFYTHGQFLGKCVMDELVERCECERQLLCSWCLLATSLLDRKQNSQGV